METIVQPLASVPQTTHVYEKELGDFLAGYRKLRHSINYGGAWGNAPIIVLTY